MIRQALNNIFYFFNNLKNYVDIDFRPDKVESRFYINGSEILPSFTGNDIVFDLGNKLYLAAFSTGGSNYIVTSNEIFIPLVMCLLFFSFLLVFVISRSLKKIARKIKRDLINPFFYGD